MTTFRCDSLKQLSLKPRTIEVLASAGIFSVGDLTNLTVSQLRALPRVGQATIFDCDRALERFNLWLKPEPRQERVTWTSRMLEVKQDRDAGFLIRESAARLGVSKSRVAQLRNRIAKLERGPLYPDYEKIRWEAQFKVVDQ